METASERTLDLARDALAVWDSAGRIIFWNKEAERLYGWSAGEILGKSFQQFCVPEAALFSSLEEELGKNGAWAGEMPQRAKDGTYLTVRCQWTLVRDARGKGKLVLAVHSDATEEKRLETQCFRTQRLESIGTLASGIAHDLNNILAPILMASQVLQTARLDKDARKLLTTIERSAQRGAGIVKQILMFSQGLQGQPILLQMRALIREIVKIMQQTFPKQILIQSRIASDLWVVRGDAIQLQQVLLNLCLNARDAMHDGGRILLTAKNTQVHASDPKRPGAKPGPYVVIQVEDNGTGMPMEIREKIFNPFFTTKAPGLGTGLGLPTCLKIVEVHGGFLDFSTEPGKGTVFLVYLPATPDASEEIRPVAQLQLPAGHGELILVVEDEPLIQNVTRRILSQYGYHVLLAVDGTEGLLLFVQHAREIRAVLTDIVMPNMDGVSLVRALRRIRPSVPVVASSGLSSKSVLEEKTAALKSLHVSQFLTKPFPAEALLQAIHQAIHSSKGQLRVAQRPLDRFNQPVDEAVRNTTK